MLLIAPHGKRKLNNTNVYIGNLENRPIFVPLYNIFRYDERTNPTYRQK